MNLKTNPPKSLKDLFIKDQKPTKLLILVIIGVITLLTFTIIIATGRTEPTKGKLIYQPNVFEPPNKDVNLVEAPDGTYTQNPNTYTGYGKNQGMEIANQLKEILPGMIRSELDKQKTGNQYDDMDMVYQFRTEQQKQFEEFKSEMNSSMRNMEARLEDKFRSGSNLVAQNYTPSGNQNGPNNGNFNGANNGNSNGSSNGSASNGTNNGSNNGSNPDNENSLTENGSGRNAIILDNFNSGGSMVGNFGERSTLSFRMDKGVNAGAMIKGNLLTGCISSGDKCAVRVNVTETVYYGKTPVIPAGSYFIGYGQSNLNLRQITIFLEKLVIGKREIDIKAHLVQKDSLQPGWCDKVIDRSKWPFWKALIVEFVTGYAQGWKDSIIIPSSSGIPTVYYPNTATNSAIDGLTAASSKYVERVLGDASKYNIIIVVNQNKDCKIFMDEKIPLDRLISVIE